MYMTYGSRAMQELLPRSSCRGAIHRSIQLIYLALISNDRWFILFKIGHCHTRTGIDVSWIGYNI